MTDLFANGDLFLPIRTKINAVNEFFKIAETDEVISAGAVTSIPVVTVTQNLLFSASNVTIMNITTGEYIEVVLADDIEENDTALTITEYTFTDDVPVGSPIYFKYADFLSLYYNYTKPV